MAAVRSHSPHALFLNRLTLLAMYMSFDMAIALFKQEEQASLKESGIFLNSPAVLNPSTDQKQKIMRR